MKSTLNKNVKPGVKQCPNHFTYTSEAPRMFVSKEYKSVQVEGNPLAISMPLPGRTFVKPETIERRKREYEQQHQV